MVVVVVELRAEERSCSLRHLDDGTVTIPTLGKLE